VALTLGDCKYYHQKHKQEVTDRATRRRGGSVGRTSGSSLSPALLRSNLGQAVHTHVALSSDSIITWYWLNGWEENRQHTMHYILVYMFCGLSKRISVPPSGPRAGFRRKLPNFTLRIVQKTGWKSPIKGHLGQIFGEV